MKIKFIYENNCLLVILWGWMESQKIKTQKLKCYVLRPISQKFPTAENTRYTVYLIFRRWFKRGKFSKSPTASYNVRTRKSTSTGTVYLWPDRCRETKSKFCSSQFLSLCPKNGIVLLVCLSIHVSQTYLVFHLNWTRIVLQVEHIFTMCALWPSHEFWVCVYCNMDLWDVYLVQSHDIL